MDLPQALLLLAILLVLLLAAEGLSYAAVSPGGKQFLQQQPYNILIGTKTIPVLRAGDRWYSNNNGPFQTCYTIWSGAMKDGVFNRITVSKAFSEHLLLQIDNRADGNCLLESMLLYMCASEKLRDRATHTMTLRSALLDKLQTFAAKNDLTGAYLRREMRNVNKGSYISETSMYWVDDMLQKKYNTTFENLGYERYFYIRRHNNRFLSDLEIAAFTHISGVVARVWTKDEQGEWRTEYPLPPQVVSADDYDPAILNPGSGEVWEEHSGEYIETAFNVHHLNLGHVGLGRVPDHYVLLAAAKRVEVID